MENVEPTKENTLSKRSDQRRSMTHASNVGSNIITGVEINTLDLFHAWIPIYFYIQHDGNNLVY